MLSFRDNAIYVRFANGEVEVTEAELNSLVRIWASTILDRGERQVDNTRIGDAEIEHYEWVYDNE